MKEYKFEEVDVVELARDVASRFQEQVAPQGFVINSEISKQMLRVNADREALSRALFNLLDNAVKYSGESRNVFLRAWSDKGNVFFEVRDEGIGISKDEQEKVFEKFYRTQIVHNSNIKGSGIGLTVVSHIVKAHGGEVLLESEVGKGTKVTIRIPVKP
jgi:signal transduction histidine kinase